MSLLLKRGRAVFRAAAWAAFVVAWMLGALGCEVAGTHDVELVYRTPVIPASDAPPAKQGEDADDDLRDAIERRLSPAHVSADIAVGAGEVRITVDADEATTIDELLAWRGGLAVYRPDPSYELPISKSTGLTSVRTGDEAPHIEGSSSAIFDAIHEASLDAGHAILIEWMDPRRARTRAVLVPPLVNIEDGIESVERADGGHALAIRFTPAAREKLQSAIVGAAGAPLVIARARSVLAVGPIAASIDPLVISFGRDLYSYTRAHRTKLYLTTPLLPPLVRADKEPLPKNLRLALACFILPIALSFAWLFFVRRFDRARPEPLWLVLATFALGGVSAFGAGFMEALLGALSPYLSPEMMTLGGQLQALPGALIVFTLVVGVSEEGAKFLGAWSLAYHRREFDEPVDGIVYGAASALGFAAVENVKYFTDGRLSAALIAARTFTSVPAHLFFGAIWGYALGQKLVSPKKRVLGFFLLAALAHGAFDTFLSIDGLAPLAMALNFALATVFVLLLRKSLRHGAVTPETAAIPAQTRSFFKVGTPGAFAVYAVAMHLVAFILLVLAGYTEHTHTRVGYGFVGVASASILLLGFAAYGLTIAMPLDVVVDAYGVTFAGASRRWERIDGFERKVHLGSLGVRAEIHLRSPDGDIRLGPGDPTMVEQLARALEAHRPFSLT